MNGLRPANDLAPFLADPPRSVQTEASSRAERRALTRWNQVFNVPLLNIDIRAPVMGVDVDTVLASHSVASSSSSTTAAGSAQSSSVAQLQQTNGATAQVIGSQAHFDWAAAYDYDDWRFPFHVPS